VLVAGNLKGTYRLLDLAHVFGATVAAREVRIELLLPVGWEGPVQAVGYDLD
jgi:hypothetical protein